MRKRRRGYPSETKVKRGVRIVHGDTYWCLGPLDGLLLFEAPDAHIATAAMLFLGSQGKVQTQTAQVFTASNMEKISKNLGAA